jgi:hypothetical protein
LLIPIFDVFQFILAASRPRLTGWRAALSPRARRDS